MSTLRTYAQLCRLPAVFTAMADVFMGYFVLRGVRHLSVPSIQGPQTLAALVVASSALYLAGMVLNDVFDREIDARERPQRPIPSGRVSLRNAIRFAVLLIVTGLIASQLAGYKSLLVALLLLVNIVLYDGWGKHTPLGPLLMGGCRFLNVILGGSSGAGDMSQLFTSHGSLVATGLAIYVAGVTIFAKKEAETSGRGGLIFGQVVLNLGLLITAVWIAPHMDSPRPLATLGVIAVVVNRRAIQAVADLRPARVQAAVRIMLLSIITLDATVIYTATGDAGTALAVVALLIPSLLLGKWMTMT